MSEEAPPAEPPPAEGEEAPAAKDFGPPCIDLTEHVVKTDFFDGAHMLPEEVDKVEGAANYRQVTGFPVFGLAQPSPEGMRAVLDKVKATGDDKSNKEPKCSVIESSIDWVVQMIWFNFRREPVVYINGQPCTPRDTADLHHNMNLNNSVEEMENLERYFAHLCKEKTEKNNGTLKIHKDQGFHENPLEREFDEVEMKPEEIKSLQDLYQDMREAGHQGLESRRIPVCEDRAPPEFCFDMMTDILKEVPASVPCIFSDQQGRGRTSLGMVIACLIKEMQITSELRKMESIDLVSKATVDDLIFQKFESPLPQGQDDEDPFIKGEFDVIKELLEKCPATVEGKRKIDRVIDACGPTPKGTGIQNLRECIIETKWKYDVAPEDKQVGWKALILDFMERYFYLICFATYALQEGHGGYQKSFSSWMDDHKELRMMIDQGKDKLEWYRTVDAAKLEHLKDMMNAPDYKENLGTLIRTIYDFAFVTYADLPRGPIKNNSMRRLAATTLLDILPPKIADRVNQKMEEDPNSTHDFLTLVGLVSYYGSGEED